MPHTEDDLRAALRLVDTNVNSNATAPTRITHPDDAAAHLALQPARNSHRPSRPRFVAAAVACAVLLAVGVAAVAYRLNPPQHHDGAATSTRSSRPVTAQPGWRCQNGKAPITSYRLAVSSSQSVRVDAIVENCQTYIPTTTGSQLTVPPTSSDSSPAQDLTITIYPQGGFTADAPGLTWQNVTVNGVAGRYGTASPHVPNSVGGSALYWAYAPDSYVVAKSEPLGKASSLGELTAIAQSDTWRGAVASLPMRLAALPDGYQISTVTTYPTANKATVDLYNRTAGHQISIGVSTAGLPAAATPTTINGHTAATDTLTNSVGISYPTGSLTLDAMPDTSVWDARASETTLATLIAPVDNIADQSSWYSTDTALPPQ